VCSVKCNVILGKAMQAERHISAAMPNR
jgi:hypothetical protein